MTAGPSAAVPIWMIGLILYLWTDVYLEQLWPWSWWRQRKIDYLSCVFDHLVLYSTEVVTLESVSVLRVSCVPDKSILISRKNLPGDKSSLPTSSSSKLYSSSSDSISSLCKISPNFSLSKYIASILVKWMCVCVFYVCVCVCVLCVCVLCVCVFPWETFMQTQYLLLEVPYWKSDS